MSDIDDEDNEVKPTLLSWIVVLLVFSQLLHSVRAEQLNIMMLVPADNEGFPFWDSAVAFAQANADAIDANLDVVYVPAGLRDRFAIAEFGLETLNKRKVKPDLTISSLWLRAEEKFIADVNASKVPFISINTQLSEAQFTTLGKPREIYPFWLAHISPHDEYSGYKLAEELIQRARQKQNCVKSECVINAFAVTGLKYNAVSRQRVTGLKRAISEDEYSRLYRTVDGKWERQHTFELTEKLLNRHTDIHVYWAASGLMAQGIIDALQQSNIDRRFKVLGNINWTPETIPLIREGLIDVSFGGHFMEAGWAIQLFALHQAQHDFAADTGTVIQTRLSPLDKNNIELVGDFLLKPKWSKEALLEWQNAASAGHYDFSPLSIVATHLIEQQN